MQSRFASLALLVLCATFLPCCAAEAGDAAPALPLNPKALTFRFHEVEIYDLVNFLAKLDQRVVLMDDKVKGKVSVMAPKTVTLEEAYGIVMAVLDVRGFNLVRSDKFLRVQAKQEAVYTPIDVYFGSEPAAIPDEARMVTALIPIAEAKASMVFDSLRPLISPVGNGQVSQGTNLLVITDVATNLRRLLKIVPYLDKPEQAAGRDKDAPVLRTEAYAIKYLTAKDVTDVLSKVHSGRDDGKSGATAGAATAAAAAGGTNSGYLFVPVEQVNTLLVTADDAGHRQIAATLAKIDIRRRQVLIEASIVEFGRDKDLTTGVDAKIKDIDKPGNGDVITNTVTWGTGLLGTPTQYSFQKLFADLGSVDVALKLLAERRLVRIIASPKILTSDNQKAKLTSGTEEPILKSTTNLSNDGGGTPKTVSDYIYKDVGYDLAITPHINVERDVSLDVSFRVSSILGEKQFGDVTAPRMGKREAAANVTIQDGHTLVIGGLVSTDKRLTRTGIPWLMDIPWAGRLFSKDVTNDQETELLIFLTPRVIENSAEGEALTQAQSATLNDRVRAADLHQTDRIEANREAEAKKAQKGD